MPNDDTIKLLKECNAGVKMGVSGIEQVLEHAEPELKALLEDYLKKHQLIEDATHNKLNDFHDTEKDPSALAEIMSKAKINFKMMTTPTDAEIADLMIDGCNMGIKSVSRYLNQYPTAKPEIRELTERLVKLEQDFMNALRPYL